MESAEKKLGFGFMRLPMDGKEVDIATTKAMVDLFLERGFSYFDTARVYLDGKAETILRTCLTSRYPRERYILTDKLSGSCFRSGEDIRPLFQQQLEDCGVEYFDYYLMHSQCRENYTHYQNAHAYETAFQLKNEGKIRHVGISFHDTADFLEQILQDHPQIEVVQLQFNYLDYESPAIQSRACYEVCQKYGKPVLVMEPVKGGRLTQLPAQAQQYLDELHGGSNASYAIRFAAGFPGIQMVLSGMSNLEQVEDNTGFMSSFHPLDSRERAALRQVCQVFRKMNLIACTACRYCIAGCPRKIHIPDLFSILNSHRIYDDWNGEFYYDVHTHQGGKASSCIKCGACEEICPQHLPIRTLLEQVAATFEKKENT